MARFWAACKLSIALLMCFSLFEIALKELAQNGRGVKRPAQRFNEFLRCLVARIRALWAIKIVSGESLDRHIPDVMEFDQLS
jgi:hypothetical protein